MNFNLTPSMIALSDSLHPLITARLVALLKQFGVSTLTQLLALPAERLSSIISLPFTTVNQLRSDLFRTCASPPESGLQLYQTSLAQAQTPLSTGSADLDLLLGGGLHVGRVQEVFGLAGAGRTQLCLTVATICSLDGGEVAYIDTKGDFCPTRFSEIARRRQGQTQEYQQALERVRVARVTSNRDMRRVVRCLVDQPIPGLRLLVVDNITSPVMPLLTNSSSGNSSLQEAFGTGCEVAHMLHLVARRGVADRKSVV